MEINTARKALGLPPFVRWLILTVDILLSHKHSPLVQDSAEYGLLGIIIPMYWYIGSFPLPNSVGPPVGNLVTQLITLVPNVCFVP